MIAMKALLIVLLSIAFSMSSAQQGEELNARYIPQATKSRLKKAYPKARKILWFKDGGKYTASFYVDKKEYESTFDGAGNLLMTEMEVLPQELPPKAEELVHSRFPAERIMAVHKSIDNTQRVRYSAILRDRVLVFDTEGNLVEEK